MKRYFEISKQYFQHLEGWHLYPSFRSIWFWIWVFSTILWLGALVHYFNHLSSHSNTAFASIVVPEIIWILVVLKIRFLKDKQLINTTNDRLGTSFNSVSECRYHMLSSVMAIEPSEFLKVAKEIDDLTTLQRKFRKHSDLTLTEFMKNLYDGDSKARLLTLIIALVSITVALTARGDATLNTVFDVYSNPKNRDYFEIFAIIIAAGFFATIGLRLLALTIVDGLALWSIKLFGSSISSSWLLSHLVRDLIMYHGSEASGNNQE